MDSAASNNVAFPFPLAVSMKNVAFALALTVSAPLSVQAQSGSPANKAFLECLLFQGRTGSYSSFDGGKSAIRLMGLACKSQWDAWQKQCVADGGTDTGPNGCTVQAGVLAQTALKLLGK
jgi:hypothetical protein